MYRLPLLFLTFMLTFFVAHASVAVPNLFVKNFTVDDYKASCQNWGLSVASDGVLYVANNSGLLTFDGNTWKHYKTPDNAIINGVTFLNDTIYTISENSFGGWTRDHLGVMRYHKLTKIPAEVKFKEPPAPIPFVLPDEILHAQPSVFTTIGDLYFIGTTNNGLYITSPEGTILRHLSTHDQSLPDNIIRAICIQDAEQIWIANIVLISTDPTGETESDRKVKECDTVQRHAVYTDQRRIFQKDTGSRRQLRTGRYKERNIP